MSPDGAGCSLTCRLAVLVVAACGLARSCICGRWLPVRLPATLSATLMLGCSGPVTATESRVPECLGMRGPAAVPGRDGRAGFTAA